MSSWSAWVHAARLRTLPLAISCVLMGGILAYADGGVNSTAFLLAILTTVFLQILSNFANDYGDYSSGVDLHGRVGPVRAMQGGHISQSQMKFALILTSVISFVCGIWLLIVADISRTGLLVLLSIGILAILAAITYTVGKRPYGYFGLGDLSVFIFFGLVGVLGSHYVIHGGFYFRNIFLAATCGFFSVGVLNLNNIRDLDADKLHKKNTLPVILGSKYARKYHLLLISSGWLMALLYVFLYYKHWSQFLILLAIPLFIYNIRQLNVRQGKDVDPLLKQLALSTLLFVILNGIGWMIA